MKRIQVVPIASDDHSARSADTSTGTRSTRSKIRLRNSSSKANKRQQQSGLFSKRPYLYKAQDQSLLTSRFNSILYPNINKKATDDQTTATTPVHWIDWLDSGMEFFGCGVTIGGTDMNSSDDHNQQHSLPFGQALGFSQSSNNAQREQDILAIKKRHLQLMERDYVQLHEDFFDSLLKEEGDQMLASISLANLSTHQDQAGSSVSVASAASSRLTTETFKTPDAGGSGHTRESMKSIPSDSSTTAVRPNKRTSLPKKTRKSSNNNSASFEVYDEHSASVASSAKTNSASASSSNSSKSKRKQSNSTILCIRDIMAKTDLEHPNVYLHTQCKLQKDKGRGDRLGSSISARGREATLEKLRDKMKLIVEVSGELQISSLKSNDASSASGSVMSAGMKRRKAKISSIEHDARCINGDEDGSYIIETRSMIELQLGFLSMQYGLLLRWDAYRTGQVVFVCLRKMCHDSFYTKIRSPPTISTTSSTKSVISRSTSGESSSLYPKSLLKQKLQHSQSEKAQLGRPPTIIAASKKRVGAPPLVVRSPKGGNHAIYQRASGATEVVLVDAPYRVPPPDVFAPSILSLDVHQLTGLDPKSRWTLILTFDGDTEIAHLKYNHNERVFETTRTTPCKWEISMMPQRPVVTSFDVATGLEIRLFEQRTKRRLRGVANGVAGMVGVRSSSSSSSYVPPGSDPFSLNSPTKPYVVQNQRLIHYNSLNQGRMFTRTNSETSLGSGTSGASGSNSGNSSGRHSLKKSTSRLASTMTVPLGGLVCQPSTSQTTLWKLTIPFTHDEDAEVTLTLMHQSDYAHWLYQELRARRKEEMSVSSPPSDLWRILGTGATNDEDENYNDDALTADSEDSDIYFMEWLYYCCFPTSV